MRSVRGISVCLCLACFLAAALSAQTVSPVSDQAKELKRTAHMLRTSIDHLKNARTALKEATNLARHSTDSSVFSQLAQDWMRIDKASAPAALEDLYGGLRTTARGAPDAATYQRCMSGAQSMLLQLATLDSDKAVSLWRMWPDPPVPPGQSQASLRERAGQFEQQLATGGSSSGRVTDLTMLKEQAAKGNYRVAGSLAVQLIESGDHAEALKVVDQAMANFRQGLHDPRMLSSCLDFVRPLAYVDPDRYFQALSALVASLSSQAGPNAGGTVTVGSQTLQLTAADAAVIELCRSLRDSPDIAMKTLDTIPGLRGKLNGIGGIDTIVGPSGLVNQPQRLVSGSYSIDGITKTTLYGTVNGNFSFNAPINATSTNPGEVRESGMLLYQSLRGKLTKDPALVKQELADAAKIPDQIDVLISLANDAFQGDEDLASLTLRFASQMIMQVEPLSKRATVMQQLIQAYQRCEGEVSAALLQEREVLVQQLRDEQESAATPMRPTPVPVQGRGTADQLERAIIAERALDSFNEALKYLRLLPDDMKLQAWLQVVQTLMQAQTDAPAKDQIEELKRTAHQLRIGVDQLKDARAALKEATSLARHSTDPIAFLRLAQDWVRIDKARAPAALEELYGLLRTTARAAPDAPTYQRCMSGAETTLWRLALLNSDKAVSLWRMWPAPPAVLGESMANQREQVGQFERQLAAADPGQGVMGAGLMIDSTAANQQAAKGDYGAAMSLAPQLNRYGDRADALKVMDQAMATFKQGSQDPRAISSYFYFVRQLPNIDPDRYLQALSSLVLALSKETGPNVGGTMTVGSQTLQLTAAEAAVIELCWSLHGLPDLVMKTLDTVPGLKSRLDGIGGIDHIIGLSLPMDPSRSQVSMSYSIDGINKMTYSSTVGFVSTTIAGSANPLAAMESGMHLYQSLRGKLAKNPASVKQELADSAKTPDQIDVLINLAKYATDNYPANGDPDLASLALDFASRMIMQVQPLSERASVMQNLIWAYQQCDNEVDAALLQEGLVLVRQLRDEQERAAATKPPAPAPVPDRSTMADLLERTIVAEQALDNFNGAMKYLKRMPDDMKLQALLQIVVNLIQPF